MGGIYFSAHWCPPCRGFTPKLAEWYKTSLQSKGLEVVFVSSDKDEAMFNEYYAEQPWAAMPFANREMKAQLSKKFKVQGIPPFVIVDAEGALITRDGREAVSKDPTGEKFPWTPPTAAEKAQVVLDTLGADLIGNTKGKFIGLYFSAHWCPPCRGFTPKLAEMYNNGLKDKMEIIFCSSDRDEASFDSYCKEMPWQSLPFAQRNEKELLSDMFGVQGIPSFVVLKPDGTVLTTDGRSKVMADPKGENLPDGWLPQPINDVNDDPSQLNEEQCVLALGSSAGLQQALKAVAYEQYEAVGKDVDAMPIKFFFAPDGSITAQLRNLTEVEGEKLILIDIPSDGAFYVCDVDVSAVTEAIIKEFIENVKAGKVERRQLKK